MFLLAAVAAYLILLFAVSWWTSKNTDNADFYLGGRRSPWWAVSLGMIGASISGVTFVSVPGWVTSIHFTYLQMVLGFIAGYVVVAYVLLPIYYKSNEISIYAILEKRLGIYGRRTAAVCFLINKILSSAIFLYVVVVVLHKLVFADWNVPFAVVTLLSLVVVWMYTYKGGIHTIVWTDLMQTVLLVAALLLLILSALRMLNADAVEAARMVASSPLSEVFVWDDWMSRSHFAKQFLSGVFIVFVMTGLDQDKMQKNLSCRTLKEAQRNMMCYGVLFLPLNLIFLSLGVLIVAIYTKNGVALPCEGDDLLPYFAKNAGMVAMTCFSIGMLASSFSSVDSAITAITTSLSVDFNRKSVDRKTRTMIHAGVSAVLFLLVVAFQRMENKHAIDVVYMLVSFLYGPMLGMFLFALLMPGVEMVGVRKAIPAIALASIAVSYGVKQFLSRSVGYEMGYELLLLNGLLTFVGIWRTEVFLKRRSAI